MIYRVLWKLLHDSEAVRNRVSTRIYGDYKPQDAPPGEYIILRHVSGTPIDAVENETGLADDVMQVDFYGQKVADCKSGYQLIRNRLSGYRGTVDVLDYDGEEQEVKVTGINLLRKGSLIDLPQDGSDQWACRYSADFQVFYTQTVPTHD